MIRPPLPFLPAALLLMCGVACSQQPAPSAGASAPKSSWTIGMSSRKVALRGFVEDQDLSGIAAWDATHLLVVTDEGVAALPGTLDASGVVTAKNPGVMMLPSGEADAEGVAASKEDKCYYVTGSHGVGKKKGDFQASRTNVFRIPVDPATGEPQAAGVAASASLFAWAEKQSALSEHLKQPLQLNGFNIEGLAAKSGKLYFGVRGPNVRGDIYVIETTGASLFGGGELQATLHSLSTGIDGIGIRELAPVSEGFLILTGNASAEATKKQPKTLARDPLSDGKFQLWLWEPGGKPELSFIGDVPRFPGKAEGLLVLEDTADHADVLVLHDSEAQGGARVVRITKKK